MKTNEFLFLSFSFTIAGLASPPGVCDWWAGFSCPGLAVICWPSRGTDVLSGGRTGQGLEIINPFMKVRQGERETGSAALFFSTVTRPDDRPAWRSLRGERSPVLQQVKGQNVFTTHLNKEKNVGKTYRSNLN